MHLDVDLTDLEQNRLTRLDSRRGGTRVELGLNASRRAFVPLSLDDPALEVATAIDTLLRITLRGPEEFARPLFIGRVLIPEQGDEEENRQLGIYAGDALFHMERLLIREVAGSVWSGRTFATVDQSQIMWELIDALEGHGVVEGELPESIKRDRTYAPTKEVGAALIEMSEVINGPDFEFEPVLGEGTAEIARFSTFYPRQGSDLSGTVRFVRGKTPFTATGVRYSPAGEEVANRIVAIGAPRDQEGESPYAEHPGYVAQHAASIAQFGPFERRLPLDDVTETATLESHAKAAVAAAAFPVPYLDFTAAPEQVDTEPVGSEGVPPRFGVDYWLGDTVGLDFYADPDDEPLELAGRITDAVLTERDSGQLEVKSTCSPELDSEGVTGEAITIRVPEGSE